MVILLLLRLHARGPDLLGINDDDIVAAVHVGREGRLVLTAQTVGDDRGETPDNQPVRIDEHPFFLDFLGFRRIGLHLSVPMPVQMPRKYRCKPARSRKTLYFSGILCVVP